METRAFASLFISFILFSPAVFALSPVTPLHPPIPLEVKAKGIDADGFIDPEYAFCIPAKKEHIKDGDDKSIGLSWSPGPEGTKSYAIIAVDTDVPTVFTDAGKEGKTLPAIMPRKDFYHWVLFNIPADRTEIPAGADSHSPVPNGKSDIKTPYGIRGINDYAPYFASDPARKGVYAGYDGPCPPWNDEMVHHYHFKVFALDVPSLNLSSKYVTSQQVLDAMSLHILGQGEVVGKYSLNPDVHK